MAVNTIKPSSIFITNVLTVLDHTKKNVTQLAFASGVNARRLGKLLSKPEGLKFDEAIKILAALRDHPFRVLSFIQLSDFCDQALTPDVLFRPVSAGNSRPN